MSGDHVVVTKAGKMTYGLDRFFSSLYGKAVPGLCFLSLSLLSVKRRTSYPVVTEQVEKPCEIAAQRIGKLAPFKLQLTVLRKPLVVIGWCLHHESLRFITSQHQPEAIQ